MQTVQRDAPQPEIFVAFVIKVLRPGKKRWSFLSRNGSTNHLRVHAIQFSTLTNADKAAEVLAEDNPGIKVKVQPW